MCGVRSIQRTRSQTQVNHRGTAPVRGPRVEGFPVMENASAHQAIPFLQTNEQQLTKIKRQLEWSFRELDLVQEVIKVCAGACESVMSDLDGDVAHVLQRCGSDRLYTVMKTLTEVVERFGGKTDMSGTEDVP